MCFKGVCEGVDDDGSGDAAVGGDRDGVTGMVIEPAEDLDVAAVGEPPVREVGLPALVRQVGLEPGDVHQRRGRSSSSTPVRPARRRVRYTVQRDTVSW